MDGSTSGGGADHHLAPARLEVPDVTVRIEPVLIRGDQTGDDRFAQPRGGVDDQRVPVAAHRIGGQHHPGHLGVDHPLHHNRDPDLNPPRRADNTRGQLCPIRDRPVRPQ